VIPSGIEPATFRFVAQCLNRATACPNLKNTKRNFIFLTCVLEKDDENCTGVEKVRAGLRRNKRIKSSYIVHNNASQFKLSLKWLESF
jgi:hypothetical protein